MTQEGLSDESGIALRTIQRLEKGEFGPSLYTIMALASALEIEAWELLK